jgi:hypothetical protein
VHVARSTGGTIKLGRLGARDRRHVHERRPAEVVRRPRLADADRRLRQPSHRRPLARRVVALRARGYSAGGQIAGPAISVETTITHFDVVPVGVTTGVQQATRDGFVYYAYRQFAFTTLSANGGWKLWFGGITDSADVVGRLGRPRRPRRQGRAVVCEPERGPERRAPAQGAHAVARRRPDQDAELAPRPPGVTPLASAAEAKALGIGVVHGMSIAQGNDVFATVVWPGRIERHGAAPSSSRSPPAAR